MLKCSEHLEREISGTVTDATGRGHRFAGSTAERSALTDLSERCILDIAPGFLLNVQNTKRGVGKTTVVVGLHQCLSSPPHRVLTIDADPAIQCKYADS